MNSPSGGQPFPPGRLSDEELALRSRAVATLLQAAARPDDADPASGYRDLLRELVDAVRDRLGPQAALTLIVDELVLALDGPEQVALLLQRLQQRRQG